MPQSDDAVQEKLARLKREWLARQVEGQPVVGESARAPTSQEGSASTKVGDRNSVEESRAKEGYEDADQNNGDARVSAATADKDRAAEGAQEVRKSTRRSRKKSKQPRTVPRQAQPQQQARKGFREQQSPQRQQAPLERQMRREQQPRQAAALATPRRGGAAAAVVPARTPEWRIGGAARPLGGRVDVRRDEMWRLGAVDRELTRALHRHEASTRGTGARSAMRRLRPDEADEWAFVDESDVSGFAEQVPEMAMQFPFELDGFQKRAIVHVEEGRSVFVAAHTSAGKTVVAEYAIALGAATGGKVFYTSPIKTLSNQKLRDFRGKFDDVGLVTGDVSINETAQCVIMTTEILRSMLYRGADVIRDLAFVIFDEVQFLNDEERGVVWEESIIMLPPHVTIIMLSATVPNALEFASWVGKTKDRRVAVVSTDKRPVPLQHSWLHKSREQPEGLKETLLLAQGGTFLANNFRAALKDGAASKDVDKPKGDGGGKKKSRRQRKKERVEIVNGVAETVDEGPSPTDKDSAAPQDAATAPEEATTAPDEAAAHSEEAGISSAEAEKSVKSGDGEKKRVVAKGVNKNKGHPLKVGAASATGAKGGPNSKPSSWAPLVTFLNKNHRTPSVVFCFSKKKCEKAVESLEHNDLLPDASDKAHVHQFFEDAILKLREEDRGLPQVLRVRANLKRGISAHHAGLLPLIKEITEILFSRGLVKVLFATETFAMGVNMPARTVVFAGVRKHDGRRFRFLEAGEYTQMSGRAGRRGLDDVGHVYLFFPPDERYPDERDLCRVMTGKPISLRSAFRLTYNMILNVLRVDELRVEEMMKQSFSEAGEDTNAVTLTNILGKVEETLRALNMSHQTGLGAAHDGAQSEAGTPLERYAEKVCKLSEAKLQLTYRELNSIFEAPIKPGRVIVVELEPGLLSLAMIFSIVRPKASQNDRGNREPERGAVKADTYLWVACVENVVPSAVDKQPTSILFFPEPVRNNENRWADGAHPRIVSENGLVVTLRETQAMKILYITDLLDKVSEQREAEQLSAAKGWRFRRIRKDAKKALVPNALYLDKVVAKWKARLQKLPAAESFPAEYFSQGKRGGFDLNGDAGASKKQRNRRAVNDIHPAYQLQVEYCRDIITSDADLALGLRAEARSTFAVRLERLVLEGGIRRKMTTLTAASQSGSQPSLLPEYQKRVQVLQKLGYIGEDGLSVQLKGRCGCEVATADSVILTEIVLENVFQGLEPEEVASLLSSLVCRKKNGGSIHEGDSKKYSAAYIAAKRALRTVVYNVGRAQEECGVELEFDIADGGKDYEDSICRWELAHAVYAWARGEPFFTITDLTDQQEGDIVVCVKRLSELLRDAQSVANGVGNEDLAEVLDSAITAIRRDVIFNGSLYYDEGTRISAVVDTEENAYEMVGSE